MVILGGKAIYGKISGALRHSFGHSITAGRDLLQWYRRHRAYRIYSTSPPLDTSVLQQPLPPWMGNCELPERNPSSHDLVRTPDALGTERLHLRGLKPSSRSTTPRPEPFFTVKC